ATRSRGFDDHTRVVRGSKVNGLVQILRRVDPADADARAKPRGLDPERHTHRLSLLAPTLLTGLNEVDLGQAVEGEDSLQRELVQAERRSTHIGAHVWNPDRHKGPLNAAVCSERAM